MLMMQRILISEASRKALGVGAGVGVGSLCNNIMHNDEAGPPSH
jgi:hypothetical protein